MAARQDFGEQSCILNFMTRKYELKRRAERQEETRRRIVEATGGLHESVGPARTPVSAGAGGRRGRARAGPPGSAGGERAGVQRLTVDRHFPDERALLSACSGHWVAANPAPAPPPWRPVRAPAQRGPRPAAG